MKLSKLAAKKHTTIHIVDIVSGKPLYWDDEEKEPKIPFTWTLMSKHTKEFKKLQADHILALKKVIGDKQTSEYDYDDICKAQQMAKDLAIDSTVDFCIIDEDTGEKVKFSKEQARAILQNEDYEWIHEQITVGAHDARNFMMA